MEAADLLLVSKVDLAGEEQVKVASRHDIAMYWSYADLGIVFESIRCNGCLDLVQAMEVSTIGR